MNNHIYSEFCEDSMIYITINNKDSKLDVSNTESLYIYVYI